MEFEKQVVESNVLHLESAIKGQAYKAACNVGAKS